jgi:hypothetical protein
LRAAVGAHAYRFDFGHREQNPSMRGAR